MQTMDGLTIRQGQSLVDTGQTASEIKKGHMKAPMEAPSLGSPGGSPDGSQGDQSFAATLKDAVNSVNALQKASDVKMQELATGKTTNIPEVMMAAEKADIALRMMVQVRNKIIDAYQE